MFLAAFVILWVLVISNTIINIFFLKKFKPKPLTLDLQDRGVDIGKSFSNLDLHTIEGKEVNLKTKQHYKGTILVFLSVQCGVCTTIYPEIKKFTSQNKNTRVITLIRGSEQEIEELIKKYNIDTPTVRLTETLMEDFQISLYPFSYFISNQGNLNDAITKKETSIIFFTNLISSFKILS
ncbi:redoxin domain-containing protein [Bacillus sp. CH30_1T]|uniref:TlpA family protein disulfide reductase n=1 Tax=Bacillus sp. CH30_1T TaxID=2604836 RepID=UPI0011EF878C|nr:redoxin domain-containing protein [Bacillus sp. CH30_1T]KAA0564624.1 redoxin domain-containing protein [Bacillus sp. CH30_1T]